MERIKEESYFFRLSKYQDRLIKYIEDHPDFIQPPSRQKEMIANFLKPGLEDLCVSRTSFTWGIPVEFDPKHIVYVWVDALSNYITALGYGTDHDELFKKYWPADVQIVGKEIVRFHTIIWPAMLMALDLPLPKQVFGHGWLIIDGGKMSKSKGNVVDPKVLIERYGLDAVRYFLLREIAFGQDGNFTNEALIQRINSDLANDLGNLVSRTVGMIDKYFGGKLPANQAETEFDADLKAVAAEAVVKFEEYMDKMMFSDALESLWTLIRRTNKYIDETQPWVLAKNEEDMPKLAGALYNVAESIRIVSIMLQPFMPKAPKLMQAQLGIEKDTAILEWDTIKTWGLLPKELKVEKGPAIFPRIDMKKELVELAEAIKKAQEDTVVNKVKREEAKQAEAEKEKAEEITIDDFAKVHLVTGEVIASEAVKGSSKLLKNTVKVGENVRTILSGIAKHYSPEEMVGKKVVIVENLAPRKMMGEMSNGMILCAEDENGNLSLLTDDKQFESGSEVR